MVALASAFVRLRPDASKAEWTKAGKEMGDAAGDGFVKGRDGKLRDSNGRFIKDSADAGGKAGEGAGKEFGTGYTRGADGKLRDSRGKFVKDSEALGRESGGRAGGAFGTSFGKGTSGAFASLKSNLKLAAGVFVPLGLAGAVGQIAKIGIAYEDNLNIFRSVSKATAKEMANVADKARQLGADVTLPGVSAAGAAAAMTELAKAGFSVQESMDAAQATLQLARVAGIDEASAAEIAANAVNAFGIEAKDTTFVVDELAAAANSSSIEISDASDAFKQAAAVYAGLQGPAVGAKESITELNTAVAILGNNGIKGSDAGTSLKQMLLQLTGPSEKAKGIMAELAAEAFGANVSLKQQTDILHGGAKARGEALLSLEKVNPQLKNMGDIAYDGAGKMRPLRDIIDLVAKGTKNMSQEERNFAITQIFGADSTRAVLALIKGGVPVYDAQRKAILQAGAAADFAKAKNAGLGGAIDNVKSQFENAAISIYNQVKGPLTSGLNAFAGALPKIFQDIGNFAKFVKDNIVVIRDWALAIGAVTLALKINSIMLAINSAGSVVKFIQGISIITKITQGWAAAQALLNATLIANPIGIVIVAVTALVAGIILLYRHNETFRKIVQQVWAAIKVAIAATVDWIVNTAWPAIVKAYQAVAAAALWLWHNAIEPAWNGILAAIKFVVGFVKGFIDTMISAFRAVAAVVNWLYTNIFAPVFAAIRKVVEVWWLAVQISFALFKKGVEIVVGGALNAIKGVFTFVFDFINKNVIQPWWTAIKTVFGLFKTYLLGPLVQGLQVAAAFFGRVFSGIATTVTTWYRATIVPIFNAVKAAWTAVAVGFVTVYETKIKPLFNTFVGFIKNNIVGGFKTGVSAITTAWDKVRDAARVPVAFVVNKVINPFIGGLNAAAKIVGVKDRVAPIAGFARGGKISGAGGMTDNRQAVIPGVGAVQLQGGEFIVKRSMTGKALPLLRWVNEGMKGGPQKVASYLGKPVADMPGDGSEGWAFKDGGLIGWAKDVWGAVSNPLETIKKPFESALASIPGGGMIKDFLGGAARQLLNGAVGWLGRIGSGGGKVGDAISFLRNQNGKPYGWADAGPDAYDCSGIVAAVYNILHGRSPYGHTFSTDSAGQFFPKSGYGGPMVAAWSHPGQAPASNSVGHMMGRVGTTTFESTGSRGVHLGATTRRLSDFANIGHYVDGGLFREPVRLFDQGGYWPSGTLGANLSGRTEYVDPQGRGGAGRTYVINQNISPGAHPAEVGRQAVLAIQAFERGNGAAWRDG